MCIYATLILILGPERAFVGYHRFLPAWIRFRHIVGTLFLVYTGAWYARHTYKRHLDRSIALTAVGWGIVALSYTCLLLVQQYLVGTCAPEHQKVCQICCRGRCTRLASDGGTPLILTPMLTPDRTVPPGSAGGALACGIGIPHQ